MSLGLLVEGESDRAAIPILVRRLGYRHSVRASIAPRGDMLKFDKIRQSVISLIRRRSDIDLVVVCIDAETSDPNSFLAQEAMPVQRRLNRDRAIHVPVRYAVVDHALEGWLACDEDALRSVLGGGRARINIQGNPDRHPNPALILDRVFMQNNRDFRKTLDNPKIAQAATPQNIAAKSPTFRRFAQLIGHPITP